MPKATYKKKNKLRIEKSDMSFEFRDLTRKRLRSILKLSSNFTTKVTQTHFQL